MKPLLRLFGLLLCMPVVLLHAAEQEGLEQVLARVPSAPKGLPLSAYPQETQYYDTGEGMRIAVSVVTSALSHPWGLVQLPDSTILVTERNLAQLRVIRNDILDPDPVAGIPPVSAGGYTGLLDVIMHPDFADNHLLYFTYNKKLGIESAAMAILRAEWNGRALINAEDIFIADPGVSGASRLMFGADGMLYMSIYGGGADAQDLSQLRGKILRLTADGKIPSDNPFIGRQDVRPEIYTWGHRTTQGLAHNPITGELWQLEMGPNGGDEINALQPGANYGWPHVSLGRDYAGSWQGDFHDERFADPEVYWMPSISVSGMTFYDGDKLPAWRGDLFVGGLRMGEIPGTGLLQRIRFNGLGQEIRREFLLFDLRYRIRGAHQGSDGYLYVMTDEDQGAILRIGAVE